jgi:hypothetical protein
VRAVQRRIKIPTEGESSDGPSSTETCCMRNRHCHRVQRGFDAHNSSRRYWHFLNGWTRRAGRRRRLVADNALRFATLGRFGVSGALLRTRHGPTWAAWGGVTNHTVRFHWPWAGQTQRLPLSSRGGCIFHYAGILCSICGVTAIVRDSPACGNHLGYPGCSFPGPVTTEISVSPQSATFDCGGRVSNRF